MRVWCQRALSISRHEVRQVLSHPVEWIAGLAVPLFWALLMSIAFGTGIMTKLPVGLVDMDRSALSRETIQALDAIPSIRLETRESSLAADEDLRARRTYGTITIPKGFYFQINNPCQPVIGRHKQQGKDKGDTVYISKGDIQIRNAKTGEKHQ